jgi:predicted transcriptional regulator
MLCPNCEYPMEEIEFGNSSSDETEIGFECEICEHKICPDDAEDYVLNAWYGDII